MFSNDLTNAYLYECERRNDDRRRVAESQRAGLLRKRPAPAAVFIARSVLVVASLWALTSQW